MRFAYYRRAALNAGVPEMWADDAAQDIALRVWRAGHDTSTIVYRAAVDAARVYGPHSRGGVDRTTAQITEGHGYGHALDLRLDFLAGLARLTHLQRTAYVAWYRGERPPDNRSQKFASLARARLRAAVS